MTEQEESPLRGITKWGSGLAEAFAEGMRANLGEVSGAAQALAAALVPSLPTYLQLVVDGQPTMSKAAEIDWIQRALGSRALWEALTYPDPAVRATAVKVRAGYRIRLRELEMEKA